MRGVNTLNRIFGTKYIYNSQDKVFFHDLPIGAQFEYCGEPYIKIEPQEDNAAFCYTFGKIRFFNYPTKVIKKTFNITIT